MTWNQISQTMVLAGIVCGTINFCSEIKRRNEASITAQAAGQPALPSQGPVDWIMILLIQVGTSLVAAFVVPLFLNATSSQILDNISKDGSSYWNFFAFCFLAAFLPSPFITGLSARVLAQKADEKATDASAKANAATGAAKTATETAKQATDTAKEASDKAKTATAKAEAVAVGHEETKKTLFDLTASVTEPDALPGPQRLVNLDADAVVLSPDEKKALASFKNTRYLWRSQSGIAQDAGLTLETVQPILNSLVQKEMLEREDRPEGERWSLVRPRP